MRPPPGKLFCLAAVLCTWAGPASAVSRYTITELPQPCTWPHPLYAGISDQGHVVAEWCLDGWLRGYIWEDGEIRDLGDLGASACSPNAVNDLGQVTGKAHINGSATRAFRWADGVMTELSPLAEGDSYSDEGVAINSQGVIAGYSNNAQRQLRACIWTGTEALDLGTLGGDTSLARDINDLGQVVGNSQVVSGQLFQDHAFLWQDGHITDLGTFGAESSKALAINNQGQIIGGLVDQSGQWLSWIWQDGSITYLGSLGGAYTTPEDINDLGQVVGTSSTSDGPTHAFLWEDGAMVDLNDYVPADSGWLLDNACAINDSGWIAGYGSLSGEPHGYLLVPRPDPLLDVDASGEADALTDGVLILRYLFGFTGDALVADALDPTAARTDPDEIAVYLDDARGILLDVDASGEADALTDGILILRHLFGFTGDALVADALDPDATRTDPDEILAFLDQFHPTGQSPLFAPLHSFEELYPSTTAPTPTTAAVPEPPTALLALIALLCLAGGKGSGRSRPACCRHPRRDANASAMNSNKPSMPSRKRNQRRPNRPPNTVA